MKGNKTLKVSSEEECGTFFLKIHQECSPAYQPNESSGPNKHLPLCVDCLMGKHSLMSSLPDTDILYGCDHQGREKVMGELLMQLTIKEIQPCKVCSVYSELLC